MTEEMKNFLEKLSKDETLQKKMGECKSPEDVFSVAKGMVDGLSFEDFTDTMTKLNEFITKKNSGELTDEDLDRVAGGFFGPDYTTQAVVAGVLGGVTGLTIVGAAAAAAI